MSKSIMKGKAMKMANNASDFSFCGSFFLSTKYSRQKMWGFSHLFWMKLSRLDFFRAQTRTWRTWLKTLPVITDWKKCSIPKMRLKSVLECGFTLLIFPAYEYAVFDSFFRPSHHSHPGRKTREFPDSGTSNHSMTELKINVLNRKLMVNWWFWSVVGFLGSPYEKDCYFETPQANPKPPIHTTNLLLVETYGSEKNVKNAAQQVFRGSMHVHGPLTSRFPCFGMRTV